MSKRADKQVYGQADKRTDAGNDNTPSSRKAKG